MFWLPPVRFSTTSGWDQTACNPCDSTRAMVSGEPPGGSGTMMRIGRSGKVCAPANEQIRARQPAHSNFFMRALLGPHPRVYRSLYHFTVGQGYAKDPLRKIPATGRGHQGAADH